MIAKGQVVDSKTRVSIPGVNVGEYRNNQLVNGTITDVDGNFRKEVASGNVLRFSAMGYTTNQPVLHDNVLITVPLTETSYDVPTVVVTAKRTYYKYYLAALVLAVSIFIYYKY